VRLRLLPEPRASRREAAITAEHVRLLEEEQGFTIVQDDDECDVGLAFGPEGASLLAELPARARAWLVEDVESWSAGRPASWSTPLHVIAAADWIAERIADLRGGHPPPVVRLGIDKTEPAASARALVNLDGPLRVLVVADEHSRWKDALRVAAGMREPHVVTLLQVGVVASDPSPARTLGPLTARETESLLRRNDVVLRMAPDEALPYALLEAFHGGATCVTLPVAGHAEALTHGFNGLVSSHDDDRGGARALDLLARDRRLLAYLRENATATARGWPSCRQAAAMLALALRRLARTAC
jgi:glycosyltransferase involved in cell wall biosynthesis